MIRRLAAAAIWVLLLHLNLIASDLVCAQHSEMADRASPAMTRHHAPANSAQKSSVTDGDHDGCRVPARADCCRAMASCAVNLGIGASPSAVAPPIVRSLVTADPHSAPLSFALAPEPPPPKA